ncbi:next to BRCA1 gene 1 protein [Rhypophila decipiens]
MASALAQTTSPDTPVTLKLSVDGVNRRFKLPLRELGPLTLEEKLRRFLDIPADIEAVFERYSDSAAAYMVLDKNNTSVYKQLYRAAKAKQKLKIRVTVQKPAEEEEKKGPKPASVEDETEEEEKSILQTETTPMTSEVSLPSSATVSTKETREEPALAAKSESDSLVNTIERTQLAMKHSLEALHAATYNHLLHRPIMGSREWEKAPVPTNKDLLHRQITGPRTNFAVCCNSCDRTIPDAHYHCSTCDDGDFDLCQECVDQGITCYGANHWLIKRVVKNGVITNSTTERIAPKAKAKPAEEREAKTAAPPVPARIVPIFNNFLYSSIRTCNCCVQELPETEFVHCTTCEDFDLCRACFARNRHGHHPKHPFVPAVEGTRLEPEVARRLLPGRNQAHSAICDGCDHSIRGIRHKCLDCPDWDYCSGCYENAAFVHPGHRFVPLYEALETNCDARIRSLDRQVHFGVCCDGPLCGKSRLNSEYIVGDRYKCAVCHDTDFCASCEASPANNHNRTHPLIKFKTPVRHVSVTTSGEHENGRPMPAMGDRVRRVNTASVSRATETPTQNAQSTNVLTVVDVKPEEPVAPVKVEEKKTKTEETEKPLAIEKLLNVEELDAVYVRDTVADGTVYGPDHVFEQTWLLRNEGTAPWPAGCSVKYVGGDYMGHVDSARPAATRDLEESSESTICYSPVAPGEEFGFTVLLRTPLREGRVVSNWRLTTPEGLKFGHRLWCDVIVKRPTPVKVEQPSAEKETKEPVAAPEVVEIEDAPIKLEESQMIFPKLEKESPVSSIHQDTKSESAPTEEEYEDCEDVEWAVEVSDDGFLTDEEYDVLDASDEEYLEGQGNPLVKK